MATLDACAAASSSDSGTAMSQSKTMSKLMLPPAGDNESVEAAAADEEGSGVVQARAHVMDEIGCWSPKEKSGKVHTRMTDWATEGEAVGDDALIIPQTLLCGALQSSARDVVMVNGRSDEEILKAAADGVRHAATNTATMKAIPKAVTRRAAILEGRRICRMG
jgi:hypothetical protein